jgi:dienelactone hydrolase
MSSNIEALLPYAVETDQRLGLLVRTGDRQPTAAVVLLPDWRGQSELARDHAHYLVHHDCVVAIADLYGDGFSPTDPSQVGPKVKRLLDHRDTGVKALHACVEALREHVPLGVPVFCLGYSAGGMIALDYGRSGANVAGIIVCSGLLKTATTGMPARIAAPVLLLQGTQDVVSPMTVVNEVISEMDAAGNDFRVELYGQTHHAFDNPEAGTDPTARLVYSPNAAARARQAIVEFLRAR